MKTINKFSIFTFILCNIFLVLEISLRLILPPVPQADLIRDRALFSKHPTLIFKHVKDQVVKESKYVGDKTIFKDVQYSFDSFGRRKTWIDPNTQKQGSALFIGSSVVFGKGLNDDQTLPSFFAKLHPELEVHNYAVRGWGTQQYLELLRTTNFKDEVDNPLQYLFFVISVNKETGHVQRLQGSMDLCTPCWWMANLPAYRQTRDTRSFQNKGTFDEYMPLRFYLYKFLQNLRVVRYFGINVSKMKQSDYDTYGELLLEILTTAKTLYPKTKVVFINHPFSDIESTKKLEKTDVYNELPILEYSQLIAKDELKAYYFGMQWPYPKPKLNKRIATEISSDILSPDSN